MLMKNDEGAVVGRCDGVVKGGYTDTRPAYSQKAAMMTTIAINRATAAIAFLRLLSSVDDIGPRYFLWNSSVLR
jgi:hypothetical protein